MKKMLAKGTIYFVLIFVTGILFLIAAGPFIFWNSIKPASLNIWIVDKTVPVPDYREHKGLMWVLKHNKIFSAKTENVFREDKDYYGFYPVSKGTYEINKLPESKENPDLIYLTDTYGVYTDDYLTPNTKGTRSDLIYGGLTDEEMKSIKINIGGGNTIIGEFNIASAPTNEENRKELGKIFGLNWTGWKGRYFKELDRDIEVPVWVVDSYERQMKKKWAFQGEGYVLVSDNDQIVVMEAGKHIGKNGLKISFNKGYVSEFSIDKQIPYQYWFEFVNIKPGCETVASYKLDITDEGKERLDEIGLSAEFPAVIRFKNTQYTSYYFAGDYADLEKVYGMWNYYGFDKLKKITSSLDKKTSDYFYWNCYVPMMNKIISDIKDKKSLKENLNDKEKDVKLYSKAEGKGFKILDKGIWKDFYIKGVNIGAALPGKWFTEFPEDEEVFLGWFEKIGQMKANCIRVYTLLPPEFYKALENYNKNHPKEKLWLFQEIWPEENPKDHDYLKKAYVDEYFKEIENVINAVHGKANIPERNGRASGIYTSDVSQYIIGYMVGRELEPEEIISTNEKNKGHSFKGEYLSNAAGSSPSEAWLAMNCDYVLKFEEENFKVQHPVSIVSWPTLDILEHDSEWNDAGDKSKEYNDKVSIDINNFNVGSKMKAGFFGAYHIYPNYPDFMNNESKYNTYTDDEGRFRYGGYLKEFIDKHTKFPALVAEFGLPTGMGNAHANPDGYNHGGLTEEQQGKGIVRMMKAINREGYAGGLIFEWMDEWAKKTWITEPYMIPYDRHVFWHNAIDPEQNYGILAMESQIPEKSEFSYTGNKTIKVVSLKHDETYLYINILADKKLNFDKEHLLLGLDTYDRNRGEFKFLQGISATASSGLEFLLEFKGTGNSKIKVHPGYNISSNRFSSFASSNGIFEDISQLINNARVTKDGRKIEAVYQDGSKLYYGDFKDNSYNHWYMDGNQLHIRIPWGRMNFSDPSGSTVLDEDRKIVDLKRDSLKTVRTDGIIVSTLLADSDEKVVIDMLSSDKPYTWSQWDVTKYTERLKGSYYIIRDYFDQLN